LTREWSSGSIPSYTEESCYLKETGLKSIERKRSETSSINNANTDITRDGKYSSASSTAYAGETSVSTQLCVSTALSNESKGYTEATSVNKDLDERNSKYDRGSWFILVEKDADLRSVPYKLHWNDDSTNKENISNVNSSYSNTSSDTTTTTTTTTTTDHSTRGRIKQARCSKAQRGSGKRYRAKSMGSLLETDTSHQNDYEGSSIGCPMNSDLNTTTVKEHVENIEKLKKKEKNNSEVRYERIIKNSASKPRARSWSVDDAKVLVGNHICSVNCNVSNSYKLHWNDQSNRDDSSNVAYMGKTPENIDFV
jgi:hypothetical protein